MVRSSLHVLVLLLLLVVPSEAYGEGFGAIKRGMSRLLANQSLAGPTSLDFLAPTNCALLSVVHREAKLNVRLELQLQLQRSALSDLPRPCARVQVRSSTAHTWYFMTPPPVSVDAVTMLCPRDSESPGFNNGNSDVISVAYRGHVRLGRGYHRLSAFLTMPNGLPYPHLPLSHIPNLQTNPASAPNGQHNVTMAKAYGDHGSLDGGDTGVPHVYIGILHSTAAPVDVGIDANADADFSVAEELNPAQSRELSELKAHASASRRSKGHEIASERRKWARLSAEYEAKVQALSNFPGTAAVHEHIKHQRRHSALSAIHSFLNTSANGMGAPVKILDDRLRHALTRLDKTKDNAADAAGAEEALRALLYEVPLGQRAPGDEVSAATGAQAPGDILGTDMGMGMGKGMGHGGGSRGGGSNVFTLPILHESFAALLADEIDFAKGVMGDRLSAPNNQGSKDYGLIFDEIGLGGLAHAFVAEVLAPISALLHPRWGGRSLDGYHVFSIRVDGSSRNAQAKKRPLQPGEQRIGQHIDVCEVSMNVCLGRVFENSGLYFQGENTGGATPPTGVSETYIDHVPGRALLNLCQHYHASSGIASGERYSIVIRGTASAFRQSPAERFADRCLGLDLEPS